MRLVQRKLLQRILPATPAAAPDHHLSGTEPFPAFTLREQECRDGGRNFVIGSVINMPSTALHPGEHLARELEEHGMSAAELARRVRVPVASITAILTG